MPALDDILGPGKSLSEYFKRYDFDGNGTLNSAEEAHQLTTNLIYVIESGGRRDELLEDPEFRSRQQTGEGKVSTQHFLYTYLQVRVLTTFT